MVRFTLATGLRRRNVTHLKWSEVDLERQVAWVHADEVENRRALGVPLNTDAVLVLRRQQGKHPVYVFSYQGHAPVKRVGGLSLA
jgi:integrase